MKKLLLLLLIAPFSFASFTVTDDLGNEIEFDKPVTKLITTVPSAAEIIFELGAQDALLATVEYSNYPEAAKQKPRIGDYNQLNVEEILTLKPELIIASAKGPNQKDIEKLISLGIKVYFIDSQNFDQIESSFKQLGLIMGKSQDGEKLAEYFDNTIGQLQAEASTKSKVDVFYQVWHEPVYTQNKNTFIGAVIELCGGNNIFAEESIPSPQISVEAVVAKNPQVIFSASQMAAGIDKWKEFEKMPAVINNQLYDISPDIMSRPTSSLLSGAKQMCEQIQLARK